MNKKVIRYFLILKFRNVLIGYKPIIKSFTYLKCHSMVLKQRTEKQGLVNIRTIIYKTINLPECFTNT